MALGSHKEAAGEKGEEYKEGEMCGGEELRRWQWEEICEHAAMWYNMKNMFRVFFLPLIPAVI